MILSKPPFLPSGFRPPTPVTKNIGSYNQPLRGDDDVILDAILYMETLHISPSPLVIMRRGMQTSPKEKTKS